MISISKDVFNLILLITLSWMSRGQETDTLFSYLALGDSYTIGESVTKEHQWPRQLTDSLSKRGMQLNEPVIIAKTGWRTDEMLAAAKKNLDDQKFDLVSLLIGVNNEYQGKSPESFKTEFERCLKYAINRSKNGKEDVFVFSIPDYGYTPFGADNQKQITKRLNNYNEICRLVCNEYGVLFINITDISREALSDPDLVASDGLHPSGKQYSRWVSKSVTKIYWLIKN